MTSIISSARLAVQNGVGSVGFTVFGNDLTQVIARATAGVIRLLEGTGQSIYAVAISLPAGTTKGVVVWDDGAGNSTHDKFDTTAGTVTIEVLD